MLTQVGQIKQNNRRGTYPKRWCLSKSRCGALCCGVDSYWFWFCRDCRVEVSSTSEVTSQKPEAVTENKDKEKTEKIKHKEKDKEKGKEKESKRTLEGTALKRNLLSSVFFLRAFYRDAATWTLYYIPVKERWHCTAKQNAAESRYPFLLASLPIHFHWSKSASPFISFVWFVHGCFAFVLQSSSSLCMYISFDAQCWSIW